MNIIGIQLDSTWEDKQANFTKVHDLLANTSIEPNSLIILPEMFATGYSMNAAAIAEPHTGDTDRFLAQLARHYRAFAVGGLARQSEGAKARNEAVAFNAQGREIARYCKLHPFSFAKEADYYEPGREIVTFAWGDFTVALFVCYDLRFPEGFRTAVTRGTDLFVVIACWPAARREHWTALLRARAIENQAYVVGINRCGSDPRFTYSGDSMIVDPRGTPLMTAEKREGLLQASVEHAVVTDYRREFPCLQDRHPDYGQF